MTYIPARPVGPGDISVGAVSDITYVTPSDITATPSLISISQYINGINLSNLSSYQTVWGGVTRNTLWIP